MSNEVRDEFTREQLDRWESLDISDSFIFYRVMRDNQDLCLKLLQRILPELDIKRIEFIETEKYIQESPDAKGVRLDVYAGDDAERVYNVELQVRDRDDLPRRGRYYQTASDSAQLDRGKLYMELPDTYTIFICRFDLFKLGYVRYTFRNICVEDHKTELGDGTEKVYLNPYGTIGDITPELRAFLNYVLGEVTEDDFVRELETAVSIVKKDKLARREYIMWDMEKRIDRAEGYALGETNGIAIGEARGLQRGKIQEFVLLRREDGYTDEQILENAVSRFNISRKEAEEYVNHHLAMV